MKTWFLPLALLLQIPTLRIETGVVTGTVRQADGKPAPNVRVAAMPADAANAATGTILAALAQADESGNYRLEDIPAGAYFIVAGRLDAPTFYPGAEDPLGGKTISLTAGAAVTGIDFTVMAKSLEPPPHPAAPGVDTRVLQQMLSSLHSRLLGAQAPVKVAGRVIVQHSSKSADVPKTFKLTIKNAGALASYAAQSGVWVPEPVITPAADGRFTVDIMPGTGSFEILDLPQGYVVMSITSAGRDLTQPGSYLPAMTEIVIVLAVDARQGAR